MTSGLKLPPLTSARGVQEAKHSGGNADDLRNILPNKPDDMPLASHVRKSVTAFLFSEYDKAR